MVQYTTNVSATSNATINTADVFVELKAPTGITIKVKRVRVGYSDGTATVGLDNYFMVKLYRWDTTTAGSSTAFTPVLRNANLPISVLPASGSCKIKTTTTALALGTTNVTIVDQVSINTRALYEWLARDDDDMIVVKPASCFAVVIASAVVSQKFTVSVDHVE